MRALQNCKRSGQKSRPARTKSPQQRHCPPKCSLSKPCRNAGCCAWQAKRARMLRLIFWSRSCINAMKTSYSSSAMAQQAPLSHLQAFNPAYSTVIPAYSCCAQAESPAMLQFQQVNLHASVSAEIIRTQRASFQNLLLMQKRMTACHAEMRLSFT